MVARDFDIGGLKALSDEAFDAMAPVQWPLPLDGQPQARFFADGGFFANDHKARFIAPEIPALRTETTPARPLRLNTGRIRDQWHTMTRTGSSPRLGQHLPEPFVEVHPDDAARHGVADGDFARVTTDFGQCTLRVVVSERQQRGMLFAPIHWSEATATASRVGALVAAHTDPFSGQPENKATPAAIAPYEYVFRGFALSRKPLELPAHAWWARVAINGGYGYLFADNADLAGWQSWLKSRTGDDLAEYKDFGGGVYRAASFAGGCIDTCLFIGPARDAGDWNVVKSLFAADALSNDQRRMLLSGKSSDGLASAGPDRLRLFRGRPHHHLRRHRGRCAFCRRDRRKIEGRHKLRFLHSGVEAVDRASGQACRAAAIDRLGQLNPCTVLKAASGHLWCTRLEMQVTKR